MFAVGLRTRAGRDGPDVLHWSLHFALSQAAVEVSAVVVRRSYLACVWHRGLCCDLRSMRFGVSVAEVGFTRLLSESQPGSFSPDPCKSNSTEDGQLVGWSGS